MDLHRFSAFDYMKLVVGSALVAAAFQFFTFPNSIVSGGVTGIAQIIRLLTGIPVGVLSILINIPIFYLGWRHRLGTRGHDRRGGRAFMRRNLPQVVHRPDGRLHRRHLLFAHLPGQAFPDGSRMGHARGLRTGLRRPAGLPQAGTEPEQTIHPPRLKHICAEFINFARSIVQTFKNTGYEYRTQ